MYVTRARRGKKLHKAIYKKITVLSVIIIFITLLTVLPMPKVSAEVKINQISPSKGTVGTTATLNGQISKENGSFRIFFSDKQVKNGSAAGFNVSTTFVVPNATSGDQLVKLQDVTNNENSSLKFLVMAEYRIEAIKPPQPQQLQEGANVTIRAVVTGGNTTVYGNITVTDPEDVDHSLLSNITVTIGSDGYGEANKTYPSDFSANPHTFYVGTYNMTLKILDKTLTGSFTIGLTNATEYHRFQTVLIQAANYNSTDFLDIKITHLNKTFYLTPSNASGLTTANWTIPANASIGSYKVEVKQVKPPYSKPIPDVQNFTVISKSFACEIKTSNLDGEFVKGILIEANNITATAVSTGSTNENGSVSFILKATNYTFKAFWNVTNAPKAQVGETQWISLGIPLGNLTGDHAVNILCSLAHIKIAAKDVEGNMLPFVDIRLSFTYTSRLNVPITPPPVFLETNITGLAVFRNVFTNVNYTVEGIRYSHSFAVASINLTSTIWVNVTCPEYRLIVNVFDGTNSVIQSALVKVYDWEAGLNAVGSIYVQQGTTNINGSIEFNFSLGKYGVSVYLNSVLLNSTSVELVSDPETLNVYCKLFPLTLNVKVVDYFGQGISNVKVTIENGENLLPALNTGADGVARFTGLIGGEYRILASIGERPYETTMLNLQQPETITLRIVGITSVAGFLTETSLFIVALFILLVVVVFLLAFLYRRLKSGKKQE